MEKIKNFFVDLFLNKGISLLWAILILVVGVVLIKLVIKIIKKATANSKLDKITVGFLLSIFKFVAYVILVLICCQTIGIPITGLVALLTTASLAIGLALQDSLSNLANGIVLITTKPFHEGDYVAVSGVEGKVKTIKMLNTTLVTNDNKVIVLPNSKIVTSEIVNYNTLGRRRVDFTFGVAYESDVKQVRDIIMSVIKSNGKVLLDPSPFCSLKTLNESSIDFFANCWCDAEDYWDVYYYVTEKVFNEFKKANISIPFNQMEVRLRNDEVVSPVDPEPLPERVEKVRAKKKDDVLDHILDKIAHNKEKDQSKKEKKRQQKLEKQQKKQEKKEQQKQNK